MFVVANAELKFAHAALKIKQVLVKVGLLGLELLNSVLGALVLCLLNSVLVLEGLIACLDLSDEGGANLVGLSCEGLLELDLLLAKLRNLILVEVKLLCQDVHGLLEAIDLALKGGGVDSGLVAVGSLGVDDADVCVHCLLGHFNFNLFLTKK